MNVSFILIVLFILQLNQSLSLLHGAKENNRTLRLVDGGNFDFRKSSYQVTIHVSSQVSSGSKSVDIEQDPVSPPVLRSRMRFLCSGVLIARNKVITTADCVSGKPTGLLKILPNHNGRSSEPNFSMYLPVKKVSFHPEYKKKKGVNNLAKLMLPKQTVDTLDAENFLPIHIEQHHIHHHNLPMLITGYGSDREKTLLPTPELESIKIKELDPLECMRLFNDDTDQYRSGKTCCGKAVEPEIGTVCNGDDGNPVTVFNEKTNRNELIGIVVTRGKCSSHEPILIHRVDTMLMKGFQTYKSPNQNINSNSYTMTSIIPN